MFSLKKINEKLEAQEKHWKKHYSVKAKKSSASFIRVKEVYDEVVPAIRPIKKKSKTEKDKQPPWRFYNKLTIEETKNVPENLNAAKIRKVKKDSLKLHKTIGSIKKKEKEKKRKLKFQYNVQQNPDEETCKEQKQDKEVEMGDIYSSGKEDNIFEEKEQTTFVQCSSKYIGLVQNKNELPSVFHGKENKLYLCSKSVGEDTLLVALFPDTQIYISGNYVLKLVAGSISVFGYKFQEGEEHVVFSPPTHATISINVLDGVSIKEQERQKVEELNIPFSWIQELNIAHDEPIVIVKLHRYKSNMTLLLSETQMIRATPSASDDFDLWKEIVGVQLIEDTNNTSLKLLSEFPEWDACAHKIRANICNHEKLCIVLTGGKSQGKSTLLKYVINDLLNSANVSEVACLDLDPGQPEMCVPSCLSLSLVKSPLLGASFSHREEGKCSYEKQVFLGEINVDHAIWEYLEVVRTLMLDYSQLRSNVPLVVNTMGFTANTGFDIMIDVLKIVKPTHVITLQSTNPKENYSEVLHSDLVSTINRGIMNFECTQLSYDLTLFNTVSKSIRSITSRMKREICVTSYLSTLWNENETNLIGDTCKSAVTIDWTTVAIHVQGVCVPNTHILLSINASLVALCRVEQDFVEQVGFDLPLRIADPNLWVRSNECIGWGIVKGIDPVTRKLHILTPLSHQQVLEQVNVIAKPKVQLPPDFQKLFSLEDGPYCKRSHLHERKTN